MAKPTGLYNLNVTWPNLAKPWHWKDQIIINTIFFVYLIPKLLRVMRKISSSSLNYISCWKRWFLPSFLSQKVCGEKCCLVVYFRIFKIRSWTITIEKQFSANKANKKINIREKYCSPESQQLIWFIHPCVLPFRAAREENPPNQAALAVVLLV